MAGRQYAEYVHGSYDTPDEQVDAVNRYMFSVEEEDARQELRDALLGDPKYTAIVEALGWVEKKEVEVPSEEAVLA